MRTTLDIAEDVLYAAKDAARRERKSLGLVISDLARKGLQPAQALDDASGSEVLNDFGIRPLPKNGTVVSNEVINRLREEQGI